MRKLLAGHRETITALEARVATAATPAEERSAQKALDRALRDHERAERAEERRQLAAAASGMASQPSPAEAWQAQIDERRQQTATRAAEQYEERRRASLELDRQLNQLDRRRGDAANQARRDVEDAVRRGDLETAVQAQGRFRALVALTGVIEEVRRNQAGATVTPRALFGASRL